MADEGFAQIQEQQGQQQAELQSGLDKQQEETASGPINASTAAGGASVATQPAQQGQPQQNQQPQQAQGQQQGQPQQGQQPQQVRPQLTPEQQKAGLFHSILSTLAGPATPQYTVDPNTGQLVAQPGTQRSTRQLSNSIVAGALTGMLAGESAPVGSPMGGFARGFQATQAQAGLANQQAQQQAIQAQKRKQEIQEADDTHKIRLAQVQEGKYRTLMLSLDAAKKSDEFLKDQDERTNREFETWEKNPGMVTDKMNEEEAKKFGLDPKNSDWIPRKVGHSVHIGPDGNPEQNPDGSPKMDFEYRYVNVNGKSTLSPEALQEGQKLNLPGLKGLTADHEITNGTKSKIMDDIDIYHSTQAELDQEIDNINRGNKKGEDTIPHVDLAAMVAKNPNLMRDLHNFQRVHDSTGFSENRPDLIIQAMANHPDPAVKSSAGKIAGLFGADALAKLPLRAEAEAIKTKAQAQAEGKAEGEEAKPTKMNEDTAASILSDHKSTPEQTAQANKFLEVKRGQAAAKTGTEEEARQQAQMGAFSKFTASGSGEAYLNTLPPVQASLVRGIGQVTTAPDKLDYIISRKPEVAAMVSQAYPIRTDAQGNVIGGFEQAKVKGYVNAVQEYESTKPGTAGWTLNAGGTAMKHLDNLRKLNTVESRIPGTKDYQAYQNQLDTLAPELAKFYGDVTIPAIASFKDTLGAKFNRDAAITTQAKSMGKKFDSMEQSWANAAPNRDFVRPMPNVDAEAKKARAGMDPEYANKLKGEQTSAKAPVNAPPAGLLKEGQVQPFKNGQFWTLQNGKPVQTDATGKPI